MIIAVIALVRLVLHFKPELMSGFSPEGRARFNDSVDSLVSAGVVALLLVHFVVRPFYIPSKSMVPTLLVRDLLLVNKLIYDFTEPVRGDIVVFNTDDSLEGKSPPLIKRVVGLEYDTVEVKDGRLILNDHVMDESFTNGPMINDYPRTTVKKDHIFVMGDNRNNSKDSRIIGQIKTERLIGRAEVIIFPFTRFKTFNFPR